MNQWAQNLKIRGEIQLKINWNNKYTTVAAYSLIVLAISILFFIIISQLDIFTNVLGEQLSFFQPIIMGLVMAYIFNFILEFIEDRILVRKRNLSKKKKATRIISLIFTYIIVLVLVYLFMYFILPELIASLVGLANDIPGYITNISRIVTDFMNQLNLTNEINVFIVCSSF